LTQRESPRLRVILSIVFEMPLRACCGTKVHDGGKLYRYESMSWVTNTSPNRVEPRVAASLCNYLHRSAFLISEKEVGGVDKMGFFKRMKEDMDVVFEQDPAARTYFEVFLTYSGLHAVWSHRIAHGFYRRNLFFIARVISQL